MNKIARRLSLLKSKIGDFSNQTNESEIILLKLALNALKFIEKIQAGKQKQQRDSFFRNSVRTPFFKFPA